jgi:hypothetical protein
MPDRRGSAGDGIREYELPSWPQTEVSNYFFRERWIGLNICARDCSSGVYQQL